MNEDKISAVAQKSASNFIALMGEMKDEINASIVAATEQAEIDGNDKIVITLSHSIKLDLGKDKQEDTLAVSVRHKGSMECQMPDPNQPEFDIVIDGE